MHLEHAGTAHWAESRSLLSEDSPSRGFTEEKNLSNSVWCGPWTASVLKPFMDVMLTMRVSRIQQLSSCCTGSVERCFTDLIFARLWDGCCYPCLTNEEVEAHQGMLRSHSWEVHDVGGDPIHCDCPFGCVIAVSGVWHVVQTKSDLVHSQKTGVS